jgi:hypothetical protein
VPAGQVVSFRVDARGQSYRWQVRRVGNPRPVKANINRKTGTTLTFEAPDGPSGVYLLEVRAGRYTTRVPFAVQGAKRSRLTVVLPQITWLGRDPLDEAAKPDGLPNTLDNGSVVPFPRPFAGEDGLPAGFAHDVAPLLVFLDRSRIAYDLTTDLALALDDRPATDDQGGLLFAGAPEWVSRGVARRLRRFAADGGRVALFGPQALRAGVTVGDGKLTHPTPVAPSDALGGRVAAVRKLPESGGAIAPLTVLEDRPDAGLLEGFSGELAGFSAVEELLTPGRAELLSGVGHALSEEEAVAAEEANRTPRPERPAFSAVRQGRGLVIRVGIPGWVERLEHDDATVAQLTRNVVDLLRGVRPRPRSAPR